MATEYRISNTERQLMPLKAESDERQILSIFHAILNNNNNNRN